MGRNADFFKVLPGLLSEFHKSLTLSKRCGPLICQVDIRAPSPAFLPTLACNSYIGYLGRIDCLSTLNHTAGGMAQPKEIDLSWRCSVQIKGLLFVHLKA